MTKNVGYQGRAKHINIRAHFVRERITSKEVDVVHVEPKNK